MKDGSMKIMKSCKNPLVFGDLKEGDVFAFANDPNVAKIKLSKAGGTYLCTDSNSTFGQHVSYDNDAVIIYPNATLILEPSEA